VTGSCTLRDTFSGRPASVCPGRAETLSHRAQVRGSCRRPSHPAKPSTTKTPARRRRPKRSASGSRPEGTRVTGSCALRDTFSSQPASVCPGRAKTLSHRAQVRRSCRRPSHAAKPSTTKTPARRPRPKRSASGSRPEGTRVTGSCTLRDTFLGQPASVCPGRAKTLSHGAQVRGFCRRRPRRAESSPPYTHLTRRPSGVDGWGEADRASCGGEPRPHPVVPLFGSVCRPSHGIAPAARPRAGGNPRKPG